MFVVHMNQIRNCINLFLPWKEKLCGISAFNLTFDHNQFFYDCESSILFSTNTWWCVKLKGFGENVHLQFLKSRCLPCHVHFCLGFSPVCSQNELMSALLNQVIKRRDSLGAPGRCTGQWQEAWQEHPLWAGFSSGLPTHSTVSCDGQVAASSFYDFSLTNWWHFSSSKSMSILIATKLIFRETDDCSLLPCMLWSCGLTDHRWPHPWILSWADLRICSLFNSRGKTPVVFSFFFFFSSNTTSHVNAVEVVCALLTHVRTTARAFPGQSSACVPFFLPVISDGAAFLGQGGSQALWFLSPALLAATAMIPDSVSSGWSPWVRFTDVNYHLTAQCPR